MFGQGGVQVGGRDVTTEEEVRRTRAGGGAEEDEALITERLSEARRPDGTAVYTAATAASLIVFYLFAMQCMSTLAVTRRETGTWKWPAVQFVYMTTLAYVGAWLTYTLMA